MILKSFRRFDIKSIGLNPQFGCEADFLQAPLHWVLVGLSAFLWVDLPV